MRSFRTWSALTAAVVPLALAAACSDPNLRSNLDTSGPPDVSMVSVFSESAIDSGYVCDTGDALGEAATYCSQSADVRVSIGWCPEARDDTGAPIAGNRPTDTVMDAVPDLWHVRVVFSELLDPSIEDLKQEDRDGDGKPDDVMYGHINGTKPFTLTCGGENVDYDGFYDPTGNDLSCPPGPALIVGPTDFTVATGTADCELTIKDNVTDKDGNPVAADQRGPFKFGVAPMALLATSPEDTQEGVDPTLPIDIQFNAPIDDASVTATNLTLKAGATAVTFTAAVSAADPTVLELTPDAPLDDNTTYTLTIDSGLADIKGGELTLDAPVTVTFTTGTAGA